LPTLGFSGAALIVRPVANCAAAGTHRVRGVLFKRLLRRGPVESCLHSFESLDALSFYAREGRDARHKKSETGRLWKLCFC
jgi:hypothetical protein